MYLNLIIFIFSPIFIYCDRNANYNQSGNIFIQQYYQQLDNIYLRANLKSLYDMTDSIVSFNGEIIYGSDNIIAKIQQLPKIINRTLVVIDHQPKIDGGIITNIFGRVQIDNGTVLTLLYSEMFLLEWRGSFYIQHQYLRIHNKNSTATNDSMLMTTKRSGSIKFS